MSNSITLAWSSSVYKLWDERSGTLKFIDSKDTSLIYRTTFLAAATLNRLNGQSTLEDILVELGQRGASLPPEVLSHAARALCSELLSKGLLVQLSGPALVSAGPLQAPPSFGTLEETKVADMEESFLIEALPYSSSFSCGCPS